MKVLSADRVFQPGFRKSLSQLVFQSEYFDPKVASFICLAPFEVPRELQVELLDLNKAFRLAFEHSSA
jgi:hypothetical protein